MRAGWKIGYFLLAMMLKGLKLDSARLPGEARDLVTW